MNILASSGLAVFLTSILTAAFVFYENPRRRVNVCWSIFCLSVALWGIGLFFGFITRDRAAALFWGRFLNLAAIFIPICFLQFVYFFLEIADRRKNSLILAYAVSGAFFLAALIFPELFIKDVSPRGPFLFYPDAGLLYYFFPLLYGALTALGIFDLLKAHAAADGTRRNQINYLFWGMAIGFIGGATTFPYVFKINIYPFGTWGVIVYVLTVGYAITKLRLMDISVVISRAVAEIISAFFEAGAYLCLVWFYRQYVSVLIDLPFLAGTVVFGMLVGQFHQELRISVQTTSDKLFLKGKYDYYAELSEASSKVGEKLSLSAILKILYRTFTDVVEVSSPRIFLPENFADPNKNSERYIIYTREGKPQVPQREEIGIEDALAVELMRRKDVIFNAHDSARRLTIPCLVEGRLVGIILLGGKLSEDTYTPDDLRLLKALGSQAAIALDHTRSYQKIKAELELVERQLYRSQCLASLGILIAGVTHEIRNPLSVVRSRTELLAMQERSLAELEKYRDLVLKHIDRIEGIVQRMLDFAREKPKEQKEVDINEVINSSLQLINIRNIELVKELGAVKKIRGVPGELEEVFINLIQNAVEAMPKGGKLTLRTQSENGRAVIDISDTGKGIPEDLREKIFDPFFSTRHEGVGLGLSIAYRIIREHGGDIRVKSGEGEGTTFRVEF